MIFVGYVRTLCTELTGMFYKSLFINILPKKSLSVECTSKVTQPTVINYYRIDYFDWM